MTNLQCRNLQILLRHHLRPPTLAGLLWANRRRYLATVVVYAVVAGIWYYFLGAVAASYIGVVFATIILRDVSYLRAAVATWPVTQAIIDWQKAEELAVANHVPLPIDDGPTITRS